MEITYTAPAILFPALSLLLLAYTNRFLALARLIRELYAQYQLNSDAHVMEQIDSLQYRIRVIKTTQVYGVASFFAGVLCVFLLFAGWNTVAQWIFGLSLVLMLVSLALSLREVYMSLDTLSLLLRDHKKSHKH
jgi:hypothetical protein